MHRDEMRIIGCAAELERLFELAGGDGLENVVERFGMAAAVERHPPERALRDDDERRHEAEQDRPHDGATPEEKIDDDVGEQRLHERKAGGYFANAKRMDTSYTRIAPREKRQRCFTQRSAASSSIGCSDGWATEAVTTRPSGFTVRR